MPKRSKSRRKYRDSEAYTDEDVEMQQQSESESSEEEITVIHENRKQRAKRIAKQTVRRVKEEPNCRSLLFRYCLFLVVLSMGVGMVINLYGTYGEYVTDAIFPPRTSSAAIVCSDKEQTMVNDYMVKYHHFEPVYVENTTSTTELGGWAYLNATQPKENLLMAWESHYTPPTAKTGTASADKPEESTPQAPLSETVNIDMVDIRWDTKNVLRVWIPKQDACVNFIVWSI